MKLLFDFVPIVLFFICYKIYGIYVATVAIIVSSLLQTIIIWFKHRKIEYMHLITLGLVLILGAATLILHNDMFIKWKPTAVYFAMGILFLVTQLVSKKSFLERMVGDKLVLPAKVWRQLNFSWVVFFVFMGVVNLYVAYHYPTNVWVNFKLFGALGGTLVFVVLQSLYMGKYLAKKKDLSSFRDKI